MDDLAATLQGELHARPYPVIEGPCSVAHRVRLGDDREATLTHGGRLEAEGWSRQDASPQLVSWRRDGAQLRLELHNEFVTWTVIVPRATDPWFSSNAWDVLPRAWSEHLPGEELLRVWLDLVASPDPRPLTREDLVPVFGDHQFPAAAVSDGKAAVWTDYRLDGSCWQRVLVQDFGLSPRRRGRLVQRLLDIDTYRQLTLLSLPTARILLPELRRLGDELSAAIGALGAPASAPDDRQMLGRLTDLAIAVEHARARSARRFSAATAYGKIVHERLAELRSTKISGFQVLGEFLGRRLAPARRTCESVHERLEALSIRIDRATDLLRTRVDIALEHQNRDLLVSVDRRAALQLRLQEMVEGLSVVVLTYYGVGLVKHASGAIKATGVPLDSDLVAGLSIPVVLLLVWWLTRRIHQRLQRG